MEKFFSLKLFTVELSVLKAIESTLSATARSLFLKQLAEFNHVQRLEGNKEICFYKNKFLHLKPSVLSSDLLFPRSQGEFKLGVVSLSNNKSGGKVTATLWIVTGKLFSIRFNKTPDNLSGGCTIDNIKLLNDPMVAKPFRSRTFLRSCPMTFLR